MTEDRSLQPQEPETGPPIELPPPLVDTKAFEEAFGEPLSRALDLDTWTLGKDLAETYARLEQQVSEAVGQERRIQEQVRKVVLAKLRDAPNAFPGRGVYRVTAKEVERAHEAWLFNGNVEACDGISVPHDTLPLTIVQVGVCLVSYNGEHGSWVQRLYRRDLRVASSDPIQEMLDVLEQRRLQGSASSPNPRDQLSILAQRGIMTYAQRAALAHKSRALWRMGNGSPTPYELLTGAGLVQRGGAAQPSTYPLLRASLAVLQSLLLDHKRFVFVQGSGNRMFLTIGQALQKLEFAILDTLETQLERLYRDRQGHYPKGEAKLVEEFTREAGPQIVVGVYRASDFAPPCIFYAHRDYACEAALLALADSVLQEQRGFPVLIDLAGTVCRTFFGVDSFVPSVKLAYVEAGEPWRYETGHFARG